MQIYLASRIYGTDNHCIELNSPIRQQDRWRAHRAAACVHGIRKKDRIIPQGWNRKWQALRRAAGYRGNKWVPDVCRHTFASYHAAFFRNLPELQLEMGHRDASLLMTRYIAPALKKDAAAFWQAAGVRREQSQYGVIIAADRQKIIIIRWAAGQVAPEPFCDCEFQ